jgi:Na+(H+)/acetate symporter ActP
MKVFYFIAWLVRKLVKTISASHDNLKKRFRYRTSETVFIVIGSSVLVFVAMLFPVAAYADTAPQISAFALGYWIVAGCYFVYIVLSVLYDKFSQEQEDFINTLKR